MKFKWYQLVLIAIIVILFYYRFDIHFERMMSYIAYPFIKMQHTIVQPINRGIDSIKKYKNLETLYQETVEEKNQLLADIIALHGRLQFITENQELIEFNKRYQQQGILTQIMSKEFSPNGHFYIIDAGSVRGVTTDMVAVYKNCLVGRVVQVFPYFSKVVLISDATCKVAAVCAQTNTQGIYEGANNLKRAQIKHISHLEQLHKGDLILSSGQGLVFPRGFGLGKIQAFHVEGVQYVVHVDPIIDLKKLTYCYVLQKGA